MQTSGLQACFGGGVGDDSQLVHFVFEGSYPSGSSEQLRGARLYLTAAFQRTLDEVAFQMPRLLLERKALKLIHGGEVFLDSVHEEGEPRVPHR